MTKAIYPGSFDPVTKGHVDIVTRAAGLFEEVIVCVYDAPPKNLLFMTQERVALFQEAVAHLKNVRVEPYTGLTVALAKRLGARAIVRGLRSGTDFAFEFELALMNRQLDPTIEVVCLMTSAEYQFVSSSLLKEAASLGGDVDRLVPPHVAAALRRKYTRAG
ncbi:MAG: pantetheine-phosphate adenylyltransferase [Chloroflexi bacterium]|nr:pantetheine-phosphate adenylyltransferase [Chloroflexota bacterium]